MNIKKRIMAYKVFIDGEAGTTGLQVRDRLLAHPQVELIQLEDSARKDSKSRKEAMAEAAVTILCLPDEAAQEAVQLADDTNTVVIDSSTAHRVAEGWVYGFPELCKGQRELIKESKRIANVGCYAVAMIAMVRPLVDAGILEQEAQLVIPAVSGYTGGGKSLIAYMEGRDEAKHFAYSLGLDHKHLAEVMAHGGLKKKPIFMPSVGDFACGMVVQLPLSGEQVGGASRARLYEAYEAHYGGEAFVRVVAPDDRGSLSDEGYFVADDLVGSNMLEVHLFGDDEVPLVVARLDNLGKGAAGSAVQNLNIVLGIDEATSL